VAVIGTADGAAQGVDLFVALLLSSCIGVERELRQKSAGMRTHTLVGLGAALFMIVSKYGFNDVLSPGRVVVDPSRVAAQIVTGIGFIGGGLIFVRRDMVRGLTTAAAVWLTAAVGAAAGAGLLYMALGVTAAHFVVIYGYTPIVNRLPRPTQSRNQLWMRYRHGTGALRSAIDSCTSAGFVVTDLSIEHELVRAERTPSDGRGEEQTAARRRAADEVEVSMILLGTGPLPELVTRLGEIDGMLAVSAGDGSTVGDSP
jgi:putative Mg2+ transporter-C (MgtC) family protein